MPSGLIWNQEQLGECLSFRISCGDRRVKTLESVHMGHESGIRPVCGCGLGGSGGGIGSGE